ncbi:MAG: arsenate reductase family protein [Bdellovibrionaceae bacterium]|nr:arsenate reductase family protein [Pseudobdellovibrionaceae bacterium]NUM59999.1 Spx/MgsR family RNA polymerase-binding regulatory protein [Pseudobdellovibrionaceae bacterium]
MYTIYGIKNCSTVKKALDFLNKQNTDFDFVDFKKTPPSLADIKRWTDFLGELPVNKHGLTYRKLREEFEPLSTQEKMEFLVKNNSMIKRPILEKKAKVLYFGFKNDWSI